MLQQVFDRLAEEFVIGYSQGPGGVGARSLLTVAREDPDGFHLLWRHAARAQFADYARARERSVDASRALLAGQVQPDLYEWAAHAIVDYLVEAVLHWLEFGQPARDEEFVALATAGARAGIRAWVSALTQGAGQGKARTESPGPAPMGPSPPQPVQPL